MKTLRWLSIFVSILSFQAVVAADPLNTWTQRSPLPSPNPLRDLVYTNGLWVAVGDSGTVLTSEDEGQTWTRQMTAITNAAHALLGITHGAGKFVAVTSFGAAAVSTNGTNWSFHQIGASNGYWESITYADGRFVAGGTSSSNIAVSIDGITWSQHASGVSGQIFDVTHALGLFVAVGVRPGFGEGFIVTSPDGTNWTTRATNVFNTFGMRGVAFGNGRFVAVGNNTSMVSANGITWTTNVSGSYPSRLALAFGNGQFVAVGAVLPSLANVGVSYSSTDGTNWTVGTGPPAEAVCFANGRFASAGAPASLQSGVPNMVAFTTNGATWTSSGFGGAFFNSFAHSNRRVLAFANGQFASIENGTTVSLTTDGVNYSNVVFDFQGGFRTVAHGTGRWVAARSNAPGFSVFHPSDSSWVQSGGASGIVNAMVATNSLWVAVGQAGFVATASDGINWTDSIPATTNHLRFVAHGGGVFVGVGAAGTVVRSANGTNWTAATLAGVNELRSVAFAAGTFVTVGTGGRLFTSPNGMTWTSRASGTLLNLNSVSHCLGRFVVVGDGGITLSSSDGITWTRAALAQDNNLHGVAASPTLALAVGDDGATQTSLDALSWKARLGLPGPNLWRVIHHEGRFIAGTDGGVAYSTSGRLWRSQFLSGTLYSIMATNGLLIGVGSGDFVSQPSVQLSGDNGVTWYRTNVASSGGYLAGIAHGNGTYVTVGQNGLAFTSADAFHWTVRTSGTSSTLFDLAFGNGIFVATIAGSSNVLTSSDGIAWTSRPTAVAGTYDSLVFRDGLFYCAGTRIATSPDGITWTDRGSPAAQLIGMEKAGNRYVAYGSGGALLTSTNLTTWTNIPTGTAQEFKSAAYGNDSFVVVGRGGLVFQSDSLTNTPLTILSSPTNLSALVGGSATFRVAAGGRAPFSYQWFHNGAPIYGANEPALVLDNITAANAGSYHAVVNSDTMTQTSATAMLSVINVSVGVVPEVLFRFVGTTGSFTAVVSGPAPVAYQWLSNSVPISGATNAMLTLTNIQIADGFGFYQVTAIFPYGQSPSTNAGSIQVFSAIEEVFLDYYNSYQQLPNGSLASIASYGAPPPLSYQWFKGDQIVPDATNATLMITNAQTDDSGDYTYSVTYAGGSLTSSFPSTLMIYLAEPAVFSSLLPADGGSLNLSFTGLAGRYYQVDYATNLANPTVWEYFDTVFLDANPASYLINPDLFGLTNQAFFRLLILPP